MDLWLYLHFAIIKQLFSNNHYIMRKGYVTIIHALKLDVFSCF